MQEIQWTEGNKSEGSCTSLDLFFVQEMLIASHWSMGELTLILHLPLSLFSLCHITCQSK